MCVFGPRREVKSIYYIQDSTRLSSEGQTRMAVDSLSHEPSQAIFVLVLIINIKCSTVSVPAGFACFFIGEGRGGEGRGGGWTEWGRHAMYRSRHACVVQNDRTRPLVKKDPCK